MKKLSTGLVPGGIRAGEGMSGSNALGLGASVGARAGWDGEGVPDIAPPVSPTAAGCRRACARGERGFGVAPAGCWNCETTVGGRVIGAVEGVDVVSGVSGISGVSGVVEGCKEGEAEAPDCVSVTVDAPLSGGAAAAMVPAKTSARRKYLLTRASSSSWISQVSGPWVLA
jgi:hypothetical protein